jgi:hydrogenase nickel incorporation protein HypB
MFRTADLVLISKCDLLPVLDDFDPQRATDYLHDIASTAPIIALSAKDHSGMEQWVEWISQQIVERINYLEQHPVQSHAHHHEHTHHHEHHDHEHSHEDNLAV